MARLLLDDAQRSPWRKNSAAPLDVILYLELLASFLSRKEDQVWVAITDAVQLMGVTKAASYKCYSPENSKVRVINSPDALGLVLERFSNPRYINVLDLALHVRRKVKL